MVEEIIPQFVWVVVSAGDGAVVWRVDADDPNGPHRYHMDLTGHEVGTQNRYRLEGPARSIKRERDNPEDTFTGEVRIIACWPALVGVDGG